MVLAKAASASRTCPANFAVSAAAGSNAATPMILFFNSLPPLAKASPALGAGPFYFADSNSAGNESRARIVK
jgi:hypothetical protein